MLGRKFRTSICDCLFYPPTNLNSVVLRIRPIYLNPQKSAFSSLPGGGGKHRNGSIFKRLQYHIDPLLDRRNANVPNFLSFSRILITPFICYFIIKGEHTLAFVCFTYAAFADLFDGYLARKWNQTTVLGAFLDPVGDKILVGGLTLTYYYLGLLPTWLMALVVGRDLALIIGVNIMRMRTKSANAAYFDHTSDAKFSIHPTLLGKANMAGSCMLLAICMTHNSWQWFDPSTVDMVNYSRDKI